MKNITCHMCQFGPTNFDVLSIEKILWVEIPLIQVLERMKLQVFQKYLQNAILQEYILESRLSFAYIQYLHGHLLYKLHVGLFREAQYPEISRKHPLQFDQYLTLDLAKSFINLKFYRELATNIAQHNARFICKM